MSEQSLLLFITHACSRSPSCHSRSPKGSGERSDAAKRALESNCGAPGVWLTIGSSSGGLIIAVCLTRLQNPHRQGNFTPSRITYHDIPATSSPAERPQDATRHDRTKEPKSQSSPKKFSIVQESSHLFNPIRSSSARNSSNSSSNGVTYCSVLSSSDKVWGPDQDRHKARHGKTWLSCISLDLGSWF